MFIPAILLYALIWFIQNTRKKKERKALVATAE
jgi:cbb3-type cytochrome oxidase subunit 3